MSIPDQIRTNMNSMYGMPPARWVDQGRLSYPISFATGSPGIFSESFTRGLLLWRVNNDESVTLRQEYWTVVSPLHGYPAW